MEERERERERKIPRLYSPPYTQGDRYTQPLKRPRCAAPTADNTPTIIAKPTERFANAYTRGGHAIPPHVLPSFLPERNERCPDAARVDSEGKGVPSSAPLDGVAVVVKSKTNHFRESRSDPAERGGETRKREEGEGMMEVVPVCTQPSI